MKVALKILLVLCILFAIVCGVGYLVYRNMPAFKDKVADILSHSGGNMEAAYAKFLESCESAAKRKTQESGNALTPEMEQKLHNYCVCAQGEFKSKFTPKEIIAIGLNKLTSQDPQIDMQKLQQIAEDCKSNLQ